MAPEMNAQHCTTCLHRHEKSTFKNCVDCLKDAKPGNHFPGWEPQKPEEEK